MAAYLDAVLDKKRQLLNAGATIGDDEIMFVILNALPKSFRYAASYIRSQNLSLDRTIKYLIGESTAYQRRSGSEANHRRQQHQDPQPAFYSGQGQPRRRGRRGGRGHFNNPRINQQNLPVK